jgi:hypothetical protein
MASSVARRALAGRNEQKQCGPPGPGGRWDFSGVPGSGVGRRFGELRVQPLSDISVDFRVGPVILPHRSPVNLSPLFGPSAGTPRPSVSFS